MIGGTGGAMRAHRPCMALPTTELEGPQSAHRERHERTGEVTVRFQV
jgi:hypothetical protein